MIAIEILVVATLFLVGGFFLGSKVMQVYNSDKKFKEEAEKTKQELQKVRGRMVDKTKYKECLTCRFNYAEPTELEQRHCAACVKASNWEMA
jgi:hypothetical protein